MNPAPSLPVHCRGTLFPISELVPHPGSVEAPPSGHRVALRVQALRRNGWRDPVIVSRQTGHTVIGADLVEAARQLGLDRVPVEEQDFRGASEEAAVLALDAISPALIRG